MVALDHRAQAQSDRGHRVANALATHHVTAADWTDTPTSVALMLAALVTGRDNASVETVIWSQHHLDELARQRAAVAARTGRSHAEILAAALARQTDDPFDGLPSTEGTAP